MSVIFILIACSLLLAGSFLGAFLWASKTGQFEDDYTPSIRILFEEESMTPPNLSVSATLGADPKSRSLGGKSSSIKPNDQCQKTTKNQ